jgi:hypothetical protein
MVADLSVLEFKIQSSNGLSYTLSKVTSNSLHVLCQHQLLSHDGASGLCSQDNSATGTIDPIPDPEDIASLLPHFISGRIFVCFFGLVLVTGFVARYYEKRIANDLINLRNDN